MPVHETARVVARPHPLRNDLVTCDIPAGSSLAGCFPDMADNVTAQVDGEIWPRERWGEPLSAGAQVLIAASPEDDGIGRAIATIAIAVASFYTGGAAATAASTAGWSTAGVAAAQAGAAAAVTIAGPLSINSEIQP